jgi:hypothetical protein
MVIRLNFAATVASAIVNGDYVAAAGACKADSLFFQKFFYPLFLDCLQVF